MVRRVDCLAAATLVLFVLADGTVDVAVVAALMVVVVVWLVEGDAKTTGKAELVEVKLASLAAGAATTFPAVDRGRSTATR